MPTPLRLIVRRVRRRRQLAAIRSRALRFAASLLVAGFEWPNFCFVARVYVELTVLWDNAFLLLKAEQPRSLLSPSL
jgi:hypothetical protein